jgi:hypothetical protein
MAFLRACVYDCGGQQLQFCYLISGKSGSLSYSLYRYAHFLEIPGNFYSLILLTILPTFLSGALYAGILVTLRL